MHPTFVSAWPLAILMIVGASWFLWRRRDSAWGISPPVKPRAGPTSGLMEERRPVTLQCLQIRTCDIKLRSGRSPKSSARTRRSVYWENLLALILVHGAGALAVLYCVFIRFSWLSAGLAGLWFVVCMLSTTGGYHRLFSHRTYRAVWPVRLLYLLFGAASGQASAVRWASDHRLHHASTDEEEDPYNIRRGFWWAHMGWLLFRAPSRRWLVRDLESDPLVAFQDRHYLVLLLAVGFLAPMLVAWSWGDAVGGLLLAGFFRLMVQYQATFSINSLAHTIGTRPYSTSVSARDSFLTALVTLGEGYHNFHHRFPADYRNGVRFFHFDPTKWWVWLLSKLGLASGLKRAPASAIRAARQAVLARRGPSSSI